jgi:hypothetical protein
MLPKLTLSEWRQKTGDLWVNTFYTNFFDERNKVNQRIWCYRTFDADMPRLVQGFWKIIREYKESLEDENITLKMMMLGIDDPIVLKKVKEETMKLRIDEAREFKAKIQMWLKLFSRYSDSFEDIYQEIKDPYKAQDIPRLRDALSFFGETLLVRNLLIKRQVTELKIRVHNSSVDLWKAVDGWPQIPADIKYAESFAWDTTRNPDAAYFHEYNYRERDRQLEKKWWQEYIHINIGVVEIPYPQWRSGDDYDEFKIPDAYKSQKVLHPGLTLEDKFYLGNY